MFNVKSAELLEDTREIRALRVWQICLPQRQYTHYRSRHFTVTSRMFLSTVPLPITRANSARGVKLFRGFRPTREVTTATEGTQDQAGPRLTLQLAAGPHRAVVGPTTAGSHGSGGRSGRSSADSDPWLTMADRPSLSGDGSPSLTMVRCRAYRHSAHSFPPAETPAQHPRQLPPSSAHRTTSAFLSSGSEPEARCPEEPSRMTG